MFQNKLKVDFQQGVGGVREGVTKHAGFFSFKICIINIIVYTMHPASFVCPYSRAAVCARALV